jgi:hypothetical protein
MTRAHRWREWAVFLAIVIIGLALRAWGIGRESYWLDEAYSVAIARLSPAGTIAETAKDVHPPFYYLLLHYWQLIWGESEAATRAMSSLFGLGTIVLLWRVGRSWLGPGTGLLAAAFIAVAPFHIEFAQETRMYALLGFLSTASMASFWALTRSPGPAAFAVYAVVTTLAFYTHVHAVFIVAAQWGLVALWWARDGRTATWKWWLSAQAVVLAAFAPWVPMFYAQVTRVREGFWIPPLPQFVLGWTVGTFAGSSFLGWVLAALASVGGIALWRRRGQEASGQALAELVTAWFAVPILLPLGWSLLSSPIFLPKYLIAASIPFTIVAAHGLAILPLRTVRLAGLGVILLLSGIVVRRNAEVLDKDGWRDAVARLEADAHAGDVVLLRPSFNRIPFEYYLQRTDLLVKTVSGDAASHAALSAAVAKLSAGATRVWTVGLDAPHEMQPLEAAAAETFDLQTHSIAHRIRVSRFQRRPVESR